MGGVFSNRAGPRSSRAALKIKRNLTKSQYADYFQTWAKQRKKVVWHEA